MKCYICGKEAHYARQKGHEVCNRCFSNIFEKGIRRHMRINGMFSKGDRIFVKGNVSKFLMKKILGELPVKYVADPKKADKIVLEGSMDDENCSFIENLFNGNKVKQNKRYVSILIGAGDEEIAKFAELNGIKFVPNKKNKAVYDLLKEISKKHTGANYTLAKNIIVLNKLTK